MCDVTGKVDCEVYRVICPTALSKVDGSMPPLQYFNSAGFVTE